LNILLNKDVPNVGKKPNCRVQVLPVQWRQEIQFGVSKEQYPDPDKRVDERDIGDASDDEGVHEDTGNATLKDITVEGLAPIRSLISDGLSPCPRPTKLTLVLLDIYEHFLVLCKIFDILRRQTKIESLIRYIDFDGFRKRAREPGSVPRAFECLLA
jgi:hypothetical protein